MKFWKVYDDDNKNTKKTPTTTKTDNATDKDKKTPLERFGICKLITIYPSLTFVYVNKIWDSMESFKL